MSACSSAVLQNVWFCGIYLGLTTVIGLLNVTDQKLLQMRRNKIVFVSVALGSIIYIPYSFVLGLAVSGNFVPVFNVLLPLFNCIGAVCHYTMLVERAVPFLRHNPFASSPKKNTVFKIVLANLLGLPAWIQVFVHPIQPNGPVDMAAILANMIINIIAKVVLTAIFLQVLLENREKNTLWSIISNNKRQWFQLLFCVFTWFLNFVCWAISQSGKIVSFLFPVMLGYQLAMVLSFNSFLYITKTVTKEILQTGIHVPSKKPQTSHKLPDNKTSIDTQVHA